MNGNPPEGWYPEQCLSVEQAVELYTKNVAWASYEEKMKGTISFGKYADMVVLDQDIFQLSPEEILTVNVDMTIMAVSYTHLDVYKRQRFSQSISPDTVSLRVPSPPQHTII